ncbi:MAG: NAD kinase [Rhodobiaceae bacterium]|nr:NAD kinase [Rhodobiaceae bacterium]|tara:strand:- start:11897 stop:12664 length:768 start_codon:yes stop_codon:yes gene_type:complete
MAVKKITFIASETNQATEAKKKLTELYGNSDIKDAEFIVALGGDGQMLQVLHQFIGSGIPIYGMNCGSIGFLMNELSFDNLDKKLENSEITEINPLKMSVTDISGKEHTEIAINEVALTRTTYQAAKLKISINNKVRLHELISDGLLISTPAGSTAYNLSADGPILPINARLMALTPTSPFRPRRWKGALLDINSIVEIDVIDPEYRKVNATADSHEIMDAKKIIISNDETLSLKIMFDQDHNLEERIITEQFSS